MTANTAQRVAVETDERLVFVDACGDMLRKLGKPIMGRELKATAETLALEVERLLELASQITTDWIPANRKLAERAEAAESKLAEQAAEIELMREEVQDVSVEIEQARRTAEFWKAEHLAGNKLIEAAKRECKRGVFDANDPHTSWCPAKSDLPSWYEYWIGKGRSDIANDYDAFQLAEKWAAANALRVQP